ncbi:hypothetical protein, partial [Staphylococcus pseudintermedius]|uniref:hypothetical protein n=1 Tax=Staphylococcus pseudintermedius TaxID=283734 RepID=UPI001A9002F3
TIGVIIKLTIIETPMSVKVYISSPTLHGIFLHSSFNNGKNHSKHLLSHSFAIKRLQHIS